MANYYLPSFNTMPLIDFAIQKSRGAAASVLGQTYNVYRLSDTTTGSIFDQAPVYSGFPMRVAKASRMKVEGETFALQVFEGLCDNMVLELGDVLVETGYQEEEGNQFIFAQRRPTRESIFVRAESSVSITRPRPYGGQAGQQPGSGVIPAPGYMGVSKASEWVLTLTNGSYTFTNSPNAVAAAVPAGLVQLNRIRDGRKPDLPSLLYREHFIVYLPLIPGEQINELDAFNFPNQDRYEGASIYTSEQTGLGGYIVIVEKTGV